MNIKEIEEKLKAYTIKKVDIIQTIVIRLDNKVTIAVNFGNNELKNISVQGKEPQRTEIENLLTK